MLCRSFVLLALACAPLMGTATAQEPKADDAPTSGSSKNDITSSPTARPAKRPVAKDATPAAQEPQPQAPATVEVPMPAALADASADEVAQEEEAPAPAIDRSAWPALEGLVIASEEVERAETAAQSYALAPVEVSADEMRRTLVYLIGSKELRSFRLDIEIKAEIDRQLAAGRDPADFEIPDSEIQAVIDTTIEQIKVQYPDLDPVDVLRLNNIHLGNLARMTRQSRLFTKVFLPEDPADWPPITIEALRQGGQAQFVDQLKQSFVDLERRIEAGELTPEQVAQARQGQQSMRQFMAQPVIQALNASAVVETATDGLPVDVVMRVNGRDVATDVVFDEIASRVSPADIELARQWITKCALVERVLAARGYLLDPAAASEAYEAHMAPMRGTMFPPEFFIVQIKGFPSLELYEYYYRYLASYERMIADEITDTTLQQHFNDRGNDMLNVARVGTEVILLSAFDFKSGLWKENGWEEAEARAREVANKLVESGASNWGELQDEYSDFWDPPQPTTPSQGQMPKRKNKGRFAPMSRNELVSQLGENDFTIFVDGVSITDEIFFALPEGKIGGPWKGRLGYYIARITSKSAPQGDRTIDDPEMRDMVRQDLVTVRFKNFAQELVDAAFAGE
ncbi:hypothetical protein Pla163_11790 [Planctomycetes bacterium Pla163]|uniref:PpiC domain-containing protein n=1 Tax=Rohdeia mirabilis TaxID=2528008 RepID=A0A518CXY9_9BACT|nr:hypothetical protein Pla163_11790 [Planctomycetes bacterium Pla163]